MNSVPLLFLNILILAIFGNKFLYMILILAFTSWVTVARLVRGTFLQLREMQYVEAAKAMGVSSWGIIFRHLLRNASFPIIVNATLVVGGSILAESGLSYLGLGIQPPATSWGLMLSNAQEFMLTDPMQGVYPGLCILLVVLSVNFIGDGIRDALDPRQKMKLSPKEAGTMASKILEVNQMTAGFLVNKEIVKATDRISFHLDKGQTLCIVGESGSGKSVTSLAVMRLLDYAGGMILEGDIKFDGEMLSQKDQDEMRRIRGNRIAMIFQDPMSSLNPVFTVGEQIAESLRLHQNKSSSEAMKAAVDLLRQVGIPSPEVRARQYPHQLSGGMCQRVVIAIALACRPELLIADEPTTALDVTVQAQILDLLQQLQKDTGMSIILITHDMGVAAETADRIVVMYAGAIMEEGSVDSIFSNPSHPYTIGLLQSIPGFEAKTEEELYTIQGNIPRINELPTGCRFHPRCSHAMDICRLQEPGFFEIGDDHKAACWLFDEHEQQSSPSLRVNIGNQGEVKP